MKVAKEPLKQASCPTPPLLPLGLAWGEEGGPEAELCPLSALHQLGSVQEGKSTSWSLQLFHSNLNILKYNLPAVQIPRPLK